MVLEIRDHRDGNDRRGLFIADYYRCSDEDDVLLIVLIIMSIYQGKSDCWLWYSEIIIDGLADDHRWFGWWSQVIWLMITGDDHICYFKPDDLWNTRYFIRKFLWSSIETFLVFSWFQYKNFLSKIYECAGALKDNIKSCMYTRKSNSLSQKYKVNCWRKYKHRKYVQQKSKRWWAFLKNRI